MSTQNIHLPIDFVSFSDDYWRVDVFDNSRVIISIDLLLIFH